MPTAFSRTSRLSGGASHNDAGEDGVCSDVHGRHDRLLACSAPWRQPGSRTWCLGDLVGGEPVTAELVGAARQLDLIIAGNDDAWALGPTGSSPRTRRVQVVEPRKGQPSRHRLLARLRRATPSSGSSPRRLPQKSARPPRGLARAVGHTHERRSSPTTAPLQRGAARSGRVVQLARERRLHGQPGGGLRQPRGTRRTGGSSSTLTPVCCGGTARSSSPENLPLPACERRRSHRRVTRVRHRHTPPRSNRDFQGDNDTVELQFYEICERPGTGRPSGCRRRCLRASRRSVRRSQSFMPPLRGIVTVTNDSARPPRPGPRRRRRSRAVALVSTGTSSPLRPALEPAVADTGSSATCARSHSWDPLHPWTMVRRQFGLSRVVRSRSRWAGRRGPR